MNTPTLTLRATRIVSTEVEGGYIVVAFKPGPISIKDFEKAEGSLAIVDLADETGEWSNGRTFEIHEVTVSEDQRTMTVRLME